MYNLLYTFLTSIIPEGLGLGLGLELGWGWRLGVRNNLGLEVELRLEVKMGLEFGLELGWGPWGLDGIDEVGGGVSYSWNLTFQNRFSCYLASLKEIFTIF